MRALTADELHTARTAMDQGQFYLRIRVEFGPEFGDVAGMSRTALLEALRSEAEHGSSTSNFLSHLADHIQDDARFTDRSSEPAPTSVVIGYRGCGSCDPDGVNQGQVCFWDDGTSSCELC